MAKYHFNGRGEPGNCNAKFTCPFGGEGEHYSSEGEARAAYEARQDSAVMTPIRKLSLQAEALVFFDPVVAARTSNDPDELYAAAEVANEKVAVELLHNPQTPAAALQEARSRGDSAEFVALEGHPSYPVNSLSVVYLMGYNKINDPTILNRFREDEVGDEVLNELAQSSHINLYPKAVEAVKLAFANPNNQLTDQYVSEMVENHPKLLEVAVGSGRFPSTAGIRGELEITHYGVKETVPRRVITGRPDTTSFTRPLRAGLSDRTLLDSTELSSSYGALLELGMKYRGTPLQEDYLQRLKDNTSINERMKEHLVEKLGLTFPAEPTKVLFLSETEKMGRRFSLRFNRKD